jgi:alkanesulfonate monooxygenase SsuD/methylene tetrahydromethanopterin reductase-like flavin-dependent oxidoreductase (luciferase family)
MFSNAGFQVTSDQKVSDALVDNLIISGNDATVAARFNELLAAGLDELIISLVPITETGDDEQALLMHLIGRL